MAVQDWSGRQASTRKDAELSDWQRWIHRDLLRRRGVTSANLLCMAASPLTALGPHCVLKLGLVGYSMSALGRNVAKLPAAVRRSNYRTRLNGVLNRCCAPVLVLDG